jgi:hypothetical protein
VFWRQACFSPFVLMNRNRLGKNIFSSNVLENARENSPTDRSAATIGTLCSRVNNLKALFASNEVRNSPCVLASLALVFSYYCVATRAPANLSPLPFVTL